MWRSATEPLRRLAASEGPRPYLLAALVWLLVALPPFWQRLELAGFDMLSRLTASGAPTLPITIVAIDEASFAELDMVWPWPRGVHAILIEELARAGARVIAFDVVFAEPSDPEQDQMLAEAIGAAGNVVLGADTGYQETAHARIQVTVEPIPLFREAGARSGQVGVDYEGDLVVRKLPARERAFWREVLAAYRASGGATRVSAEPEPGALVRYLGPDHSFPYVSYYQALAAEEFLPPGVFRDRIVLVGLDVKATPEAGADSVDRFATPFAATTGQLTPGVEVHANFIDTAATGSAIYSAPVWLDRLLLALLLLVAASANRRFALLRGLAVAVVLFAALTVAAVWAFQTRGLWLALLGPGLGLLALYLTQGAVAYLTERRQRRQIKAAFSLYVSPEVVEEMIAHPEKLVLGGVRRELTLMFTDLAGFTSLSEQLSAEQVASILNQHLTEMTGIIRRYGGTVDKFIGDAIMAFWGAPLEDAEQAIHAVRAAVEMQQAMAALRKRLAAEGMPAIHMRVGIHSGVAAVGNMGANDRFDYTAIGDSVNLAARLEGINKLYATEILLSDATARQVADQVPLRLVDKVRVKGKQLPVEIFTPSSDADLDQLSNQAIAAYREQDWQRSRQLWQRLRERKPDDVVATVHLERIAELEREPPGEEWDGSVALAKM